ncbi:BTAD domain-containing putative transcriptional regulator [Nonomuraea mangrovi]|uniref:BTAD domain-containing putative transcriptional regulator n=1 Tax=Nonomuraea mangrovi TaxID=2316207 RepID=A0ABW4T7T6_9ACTN
MSFAEVQFRILGPLEVLVGGVPVHVGGPKPQAALAALLLGLGRVVAVDRLVDLVWGENPPGSARSQVAIAISRLRRVLREAGGDPHVIETVGAGYRVRPAVPLDAAEAKNGIAAARAAAAAGRSTEAAAGMRRALALWRGPTLVGMGRQVQGVGLWDELRLAVTEECVELELALGRHGELVASVAAFVAEHPLRERSRAQLMLALYRMGRRAEALETYREGRELLDVELGLTPGPELRRMERAVLADDPSLFLEPAPATLARPVAIPEAAPAQRPATPGTAAPSERPGPAPEVTAPTERPGSTPEAAPAGRPGPAPGETGPAERPAELPRGAASAFVGRAAELRHVHKLAGEDLPIAAISGRAGVGKSVLAVEAARRLVGRFDDGQLYADLRGSTPHPLEPAEVLGRFLRSLGRPDVPAGADEATGRFRSVTARRRILVLLDDAANAAQVTPLLPSGAGCMVVVTSRRPLTLLDGAAHVRLEPMAEDEAISLLESAIGDSRAAAEPAVAREIVRRCGGLPLAVRLVAARAAAHPRWPLSRLLDRMPRSSGLRPA